MRDERQADGAPLDEASLLERVAAFTRSAAALLSTRWELFQAELSGKGPPLLRGLVLLIVAAAFLLAAVLMLTALAAVLLAELLGSATLGLLIVLVLYLVLAAAAGLFGVRFLARVEPFRFPVTSAEIRRDLEGVLAPPPPASGTGVRTRGAPGEAPTADDELEDRFRMGSE